MEKESVHFRDTISPRLRRIGAAIIKGAGSLLEIIPPPHLQSKYTAQVVAKRISRQTDQQALVSDRERAMGDFKRALDNIDQPTEEK